MNKQGKVVNGRVRGGIEWTKTILPDGTEYPGYTWNPIAGCAHECRWSMPDGTIAECYAETTAINLAAQAYPEGFAHHYWHPERLVEPQLVERPARIFMDSMSDLMGAWVPDDQIRRVLEHCEKADWHTFLLLTKNAPRLLKFEFPPNVHVGISSPPDFFMGKPLDRNQQERMLLRGLEVLNELRPRVSVRWVSFEPLSWDVAGFLHKWHLGHGGDFPLYLPLEWAVIGAASRGRDYFQPDPSHVGNLLELLSNWNCPVFFKGNLRGNPAANPWREEYPPTNSVALYK